MCVMCPIHYFSLEAALLYPKGAPPAPCVRILFSCRAPHCAVCMSEEAACHLPHKGCFWQLQHQLSVCWKGCKCQAWSHLKVQTKQVEDGGEKHSSTTTSSSLLSPPHQPQQHYCFPSDHSCCCDEAQVFFHCQGAVSSAKHHERRQVLSCNIIF